MPNDVRHTGHRDRLRKKYTDAPYTLEDHEILELLLFYAVQRKNTNNIAHDLLDRFQSFKSVFKAPEIELEQYSCIKEKAIFFLHFFGDLCNNYRNSVANINGDYITYFREELKTGSENTCILISEDKKVITQFDVCDFLNGKSEISDLINRLVKMQITKVVIGIYKKGSSVSPAASDIRLMDKLDAIFCDSKVNVIDSLIISETNSYSLIHDGAYRFKCYG